MYNVGIFYLQGYIVKQDNKKALEWLGKAADKDYQDAKDVIKEMIQYHYITAEEAAQWLD